MQTNSTNSQTIDQLNSFLRGELSAVETYRQALEKIGRGSAVATQLEACERSHQSRVQMLAQEVLQLGGEPAKSSGVWGTFAKLVEGSAQAFGEKAAIAVLEEGEDHGRDDYRRDLDTLNPPARRLIEMHVLPEQERTHRTLSSIKKSLS
ncbi:MAG: DUF2383 domain-containing protein [Polyangiaceae bacterium]